jgi:membrane protease YdiL (CAAX protease family)
VASELLTLWLGYLVVAAAVLPFLLLLPSRSRLGRLPILSTPETITLTLFAIFLPVVVTSFLSPTNVRQATGLNHDAEVRGVAALLSLGLALLVFFVREKPKVNGLVGDIHSGLRGFLILTPFVFAVFSLALALCLFFAEPREEHPFANDPPHTAFQIVCLILAACVAAPMLEELAFRGLLLPWARRRSWRPVAIFLCAAAVLVASKGWDHRGVILFLIDLTVLMGFIYFGREIWKKWPARTASSIFATAALFGAMHIGVWPTPIPLTVLGIGLGLLTIRTGSVRPAIVVHALFNLVAVLILLCGGSK